MESIYVVSTCESAKKDEYKLGRHNGTKKKLKSRYGTYLINPKIYYFKQTNNARKIEAIIKEELMDFRIENEYGKKTEWVKLNLEEIIKKINEIIKDYSGTMINVSHVNKNSDKYEEIKNENEVRLHKLLNNLYRVDGITHNNIAKIFHHMYPELFIYDPSHSAFSNTDNRDTTWLTHNEHGIYYICDGMIEAKRLLSSKIYDLLKEDFKKRLAIFTERIMTINDLSLKKKRKRINELEQKWGGLCEKLGNTDEKCAIVEKLKKFYTRNKIFEKFDEVNSYVIGFDNGVYDLQTKQFRKAKPNELVYITTGYNYEKADDAYVSELKDLIKSIYPDKAERKYEMTVFSLSLPGFMTFQEFYMMIGNGGNGKGVMTLLINITLGRIYCTTISIECFKHNGSISSNEKSQQLAGCKQARIVFVTECDFKEGEEFESLLVKKMSGMDEQNCKFLYKEQTRYIPKFNLFFVTNDQIPIKIKDDSVPRRARICPHRISFVDQSKYDPNNKLMALAKNGLEEKLRSDIKYRHAFFEILLGYYYQFVDNGKILNIPQSLIKENINFKNINNPIGMFLDDCCVITNNMNDKIKISTLLSMLSAYDKQINETTKPLSNYLSKRGIKITKIRGYPTCSGIKLKAIDILRDKLPGKCIKWLLEKNIISSDIPSSTKLCSDLTYDSTSSESSSTDISIKSSSVHKRNVIKPSKNNSMQIYYNLEEFDEDYQCDSDETRFLCKNLDYDTMSDESSSIEFDDDHSSVSLSAYSDSD